jgi:hypothetical protein
VLSQQGYRQEQENGYQQQGDAIPPTQLQGAVLDDEAADDAASNECSNQCGEMKGVWNTGRRQGSSEHGGRSGQVGNGVVLEPEQTDHVHDACDERENPGTQPDPPRKLRNHRSRLPREKNAMLLRPSVRGWNLTASA